MNEKDEWLTYTPDEGWMSHDDANAARTVFDDAVARATEHGGVEPFGDTIGLYRACPVATVRVLAEDGSPAPDGYPLSRASLAVDDHAESGQLERLRTFVEEIARAYHENTRGSDREITLAIDDALGLGTGCSWRKTAAALRALVEVPVSDRNHQP